MEPVEKSVLIVDDEPAARESLGRMLASHGYSVRMAGDSQEAIRELAAEPAQTVLVDLDLPHVPGESLAAFLRIRYPRSRIIFISGQYEMVNPERFGEGASYFRKPLNIEALLETLATSEGASATWTA